MRSAFLASLGDPGADSLAEDLTLELREDRQFFCCKSTVADGSLLSQILTVTRLPLVEDRGFEPLTSCMPCKRERWA